MGSVWVVFGCVWVVCLVVFAVCLVVFGLCLVVLEVCLVVFELCLTPDFCFVSNHFGNEFGWHSGPSLHRCTAFEKVCLIYTVLNIHRALHFGAMIPILFP